MQWVDRSFLPDFPFGPRDLVVTLGPDGLVVNTAKYLDGQPVLAPNPDPETIDGVLLPFPVGEAGAAFEKVASDELLTRRITVARAELKDGQVLHAVNDLFIGRRTHVSARYRPQHGGREEEQSSSGVIVSTGAGSTGWLRSVQTGASAVVGAYTTSKDVERVRERCGFPWEADYLIFAVRVPFVSKVSGADLVYGPVSRVSPLVIASSRPQDGVIFGDGVEEDFLQFNSGAIARIAPADKTLNLLTPMDPRVAARRRRRLRRG